MQIIFIVFHPFTMIISHTMVVFGVFSSLQNKINDL